MLIIFIIFTAFISILIESCFIIISQYLSKISKPFKKTEANKKNEHPLTIIVGAMQFYECVHDPS